MSDKDYTVKGSWRTDGFYAVIERKEDNEIVVEKQCNSMDEAVQESLRLWNEFKNKR